MIPQLHSSGPPATGRTASAQTVAPSGPQKGDADAPAFTLLLERTAQDAHDDTGTAVALVTAAEIAKTPAPMTGGAAAVGAAVPGSSCWRTPTADPASALAALPHGQNPAQAGVPGHADGATAPHAAPPAPQPDIARGADPAPNATGAKAETSATDVAAPKAEPRGAAPVDPVPVPAAMVAPRSDRVPMARGAALSADGAASTDQVVAAGDDTSQDAPPKMTHTGGPAAATPDPAIPSTDRPASGEDPVTTPRDMDISRGETGRTDPLRGDSHRPETARTVGHQLVEAVRQGSNGTTDVALNPEELGRVRLSLTAQDGVLHVSVLAERPDTHDLLRRNIGLLQSDFRSLGYTDVAFDFGHGGEQPDRSGRTARDTQDRAPRDGAGATTIAAVGATDGAPRAIAGSARLDLRL